MDEPNEELQWLQLTETAARKVTAGRHAAALECWNAACAAAQDFPADDPRRAASLSNVGVGLRIAGDRSRSARSYEQALDAWTAASEWVARMRPAPRARSSLFHLRLEVRHRAVYDDRIRATFARAVAAGYATTEHNLAELRVADQRDHAVVETYRRAAAARAALEEQDDAVARIIAANLAGVDDARARRGAAAAIAIAGFGDVAQRRGWIIDRPAVFTDEGRLMAAVLCTAAVDHAAAERLVDR
ncbi:MAG: hypothetical protein ACT4NU_10550 [Chromatiales bacterium]